MYYLFLITLRPKTELRLLMRFITTKMEALTTMLLCTLAFEGCGGNADYGHETEYEVQTMSYTSRDLKTNYSATIRGRQDIEVYPEVSGKLTKLCIVEGQDVKRGQTMFIIDQVPYKAALLTAQANVESAEAALATAELTYNSNKMLYEEKVVSQFTLQTSENNYLTAKAGLAQAKAQLINAENDYSYTEVKSPADGVAGTLPYRVGTLVSPSGMTSPLTTVSDNSEMYVYFSMNEKQLLDMVRTYGSKKGALENLPEVELMLNDKSIYPLKGRVETISGVVDRNTGTASLRAVFQNPDGMLFSGTSGNIVITTERDSCLVIPQDATYELQDQVYVFKVVDGKANSTPVTVSRVNGGQEYIVESGLQPGDKIVIEGVGLMQEGTPIKEKTN